MASMTVKVQMYFRVESRGGGGECERERESGISLNLSVLKKAEASIEDEGSRLGSIQHLRQTM